MVAERPAAPSHIVPAATLSLGSEAQRTHKAAKDAAKVPALHYGPS